MKIHPAPLVQRPPAHDSRTRRGVAVPPAGEPAAPAPADPSAGDVLRARDALIRRMAADPDFAVLGAAPYVAQQMGQILAGGADSPADRAAAYRRCEDAIGAILRPPMVTAGISA